MPEPKTCPRCDGPAAEFHHGEMGPPECGGPSYTRCTACGHQWSDDFLPESQALPLPDGYRDCVRCDGTGDLYGRGCPHCESIGIHPL